MSSLNKTTLKKPLAFNDKFLSVKPGAMGLWQASGRSEIQYPERAQLEIGYIDQADLWLNRYDDQKLCSVDNYMF